MHNLKYIKTILSLTFIFFWLLQEGVLAMAICLTILCVAWILQFTTTSITFSSYFIIIKSKVSSKKYSWQEVTNVILKDNLLTIDFVSNKLIQTEIIEDPSLNEQIFIAFIKEKLQIC